MRDGIRESSKKWGFALGWVRSGGNSVTGYINTCYVGGKEDQAKRELVKQQQPLKAGGRGG